MELNSVTDKKLLIDLNHLVETEKKTTADVLKYLSEVERRGLHLKEGYGSLYDFCIRALRYSEGEAYRRIHSARTLTKFPMIESLIENKELNLTTLSLLSPHLTENNHIQLVKETKNLPTREVSKILAGHFPEKTLPKERIIALNKVDREIRFIGDEELETLLEQAKNKRPSLTTKDILKAALKKYLEVSKPRDRVQTNTKARSRYVRVQIKNEVVQEARDQCTYTSPSGIRCTEKRRLEFDHVFPWALGGSSDKDNIRLLCRAHNQYYAKQYFPKQLSNLTRDKFSPTQG